MSKIVALGNCPSSGSTFLADLLDSSPVSASGPELNLFSLEDLYDEAGFRKILRQRSRFSSVYLRRNGLVLNDLCSYGLNENKLEIMLSESVQLNDFLERFSESFLALRGKDLSGVVFEKSPQNIHCTGVFLERLDNFFIHVVRNPIDVYKSLLRRGFSASFALITWLLDEAKVAQYLDHPRLIVVRYEDLVKDPFNLTSSLLKRVAGKQINAEEIERGYSQNDYRKYHTVKLDSWKSKTPGQVDRQRSRKLGEGDLLALSSLKRVKVSSGYAKHFDLSEISFLELLEKFGYLDEYLSLVGERKGKLVFSRPEKYKLFRKFTGDLKYRDASLLDINTYLNPVEQY
ncbi:MAG: sulfotransferase [Oleiphilaceae bacterium]|nr:sulfotransferase [Oleiphilaceae bacterium]